LPTLSSNNTEDRTEETAKTTSALALFQLAVKVILDAYGGFHLPTRGIRGDRDTEILAAFFAMSSIKLN
jgi:hypothetical protein